MNPFILCIFFSGLCAFAATGWGAAQAKVFGMDAEAITPALRETAMPALDASREGEILTRYYREAFGGAEKWERIGSLRQSGTLRLESGEFPVEIFQKKPNYIKIIVRGNRNHLVFGYDGTSAWQQRSGTGAGAEVMLEDEGRRFIQRAHFGSHLLYPLAEGKSIEYVDTVPVNGKICHQLRVETASGFRVDYYIDIRTHLEVKVVTNDLRSEVVETTVFEEYFKDYELPIAKRIVRYEDNRWVSTLIVEEVKVNSGIMPWMFRMPGN